VCKWDSRCRAGLVDRIDERDVQERRSYIGVDVPRRVRAGDWDRRVEALMVMKVVAKVIEAVMGDEIDPRVLGRTLRKADEARMKSGQLPSLFGGGDVSDTSR